MRPPALCCLIPVLREKQKKGAGFFRQEKDAVRVIIEAQRKNSTVFLAAVLGSVFQLGQAFFWLLVC